MDNKITKCVMREEKACVQLSRFCPAESDYDPYQIAYTGDKYPDNKIAKCSNYCAEAK